MDHLFLFFNRSVFFNDKTRSSRILHHLESKVVNFSVFVFDAFIIVIDSPVSTIKKQSQIYGLAKV